MKGFPIHCHLNCDKYSREKNREKVILWRKLFKGGKYKSLGGFECGNYSKDERIQERKLFAEIR